MTPSTIPITHAPRHAGRPHRAVPTVLRPVPRRSRAVHRYCLPVVREIPLPPADRSADRMW
jgi:hypothetical protein